MKKIIGVVMVGVCVMLVGCGKSDQEKAAEQPKSMNEWIKDGAKGLTPLPPEEPKKPFSRR